MLGADFYFARRFLLVADCAGGRISHQGIRRANDPSDEGEEERRNTKHGQRKTRPLSSLGTGIAL
jgi:hypothetical protein